MQEDRVQLALDHAADEDEVHVGRVDFLHGLETMVLGVVLDGLDQVGFFYGGRVGDLVLVGDFDEGGQLLFFDKGGLQIFGCDEERLLLRVLQTVMGAVFRKLGGLLAHRTYVDLLLGQIDDIPFLYLERRVFYNQGTKRQVLDAYIHAQYPHRSYIYVGRCI